VDSRNASGRRPQRLLPLGTYPYPTPLPLSYMQRWWWELEQVAGSTGQPLLAIPMTGPMKLVALESTLTEILRRHAALRTRFIAQGSTAVPIVDAPTGVSLAIEDYSALGREEGVAKATELADRYRLLPFELNGGSLFRTCLVRLADDFHLLLIGIHHAIFDAWSGAILRWELKVLYQAYLLGKASPLPEPRIQLCDLAIWERHWIEAHDRPNPYAYWELRLAGVQPMKLPTDWPRRPGVRNSPEAMTAIELPSETASALRQMSRTHGATVQTSLLAIYSMLLARWTGRADVLIGSYTACRIPPGVGQLIGCLAANRPVYATVAPELSFATHLHRVRSAYSETLDLKNPVSFRISWQTRLHGVVANLWKSTQAPAESAREFQGKPAIIHHDLALALLETPDFIRGSVSYPADLFAPATIAAFCRDFTIAAHAVAHDPQLTVAAATSR